MKRIAALSLMVTGCVTTSDFNGYKERPRKVCQMIWQGHFDNITVVPDFFTVNDCQQMNAEGGNDLNQMLWYVGCVDMKGGGPGGKRFWVGANGGGVPSPNCGW